MDNVPKKRKSGTRPKKHRFRGNQFTNKVTTSVKKNSASSKKLDSSFLPDDFPEDADFKGYCIIDKTVVFELIEKCLCCTNCGGKVKISCEVIAGLSEKICINCQDCGELSSSRNSKMQGKSKNVPEINLRFVYAMRVLGQGLSGAQTFCGVMDLPPPITLKAYASIINKIKICTAEVSKKSMSTAVNEEVILNENCRDITISGDGTWKTRGHSSLHGVCTVIGGSSGKVIDTELLSSFCKGCSYWKGIRAGKDYESWSEKHSQECQKNHSGSAGMMEVVGMQRIFERSQLVHDVRYANYIGDGDTKTFPMIQKSKPYGDDLCVSKIECVGHMQKRMGSRLRRRKQELKGKKLSDGKTIGGKGRLTDELINKITIYYGNAIRGHCTSVKDMQKAIWAIFYHKRSHDLEPTHNFCPTGAQSWCPFQKAVAANSVSSFKHKNVIPTAVMDSLKDIFKDLSMPELLKKCLGGCTQNANESLNSLIWKLCPKTSSSGPNIIQIAVNEAVILFNEGQIGRLHVMRELGFQLGQYTRRFAKKTDEKRIKRAEEKTAMSTVEARRARKRAKLSAAEAIELEEGVVYAPGQF